MKNLANKSRVGFAWDLAGSFVGQLVTLVISITLARILSPEEFGIIGMAMVFIVISQVFVDVGFTDGIIQKTEVSETIYSTIFYINLAISLSIGCLIYLSAPAVGRFYENIEVEKVLSFLVLILPVAAAGKIHSAQLRKHLKFKQLMICNVVSAVTGGCLGVYLALNGYGVYSLVYQHLTTTFLRTIFLWLSTGWRPKALFNFQEVKSVLSFSMYVFFDQIVKRIFQKIDTLFIGKFFSAATLGFYSRAESLNAQVTTYTSASLRRVIFPVLSILKDDDAKFESTYFKVFNIISVVSAILAAVLYLLSDQIIIGLLTEKWRPSLIIFQILVFRTLVAPFGALMTKALLSKGYSKVKFNVGLMQRLLMLIPLPIGYYYGINAFALAVVINAIVFFLIYLFIMERYLTLGYLKQFKTFILPNLPLLLIAGIQFFFPGIHSLLVLLMYLSATWMFLEFTQNQGYKLILKEIRNILTKVGLISKSAV